MANFSLCYAEYSGFDSGFDSYVPSILTLLRFPCIKNQFNEVINSFSVT